MKGKEWSDPAGATRTCRSPPLPRLPPPLTPRHPDLSRSPDLPGHVRKRRGVEVRLPARKARLGTEGERRGRSEKEEEEGRREQAKREGMEGRAGGGRSTKRGNLFTPGRASGRSVPLPHIHMPPLPRPQNGHEETSSPPRLKRRKQAASRGSRGTGKSTTKRRLAICIMGQPHQNRQNAPSLPPRRKGEPRNMYIYMR